MKKEKLMYEVAEILLIIGGLNWGLGLFDINLVSIIAGSGLLAKVIYGAVGVSALYLAYVKWFKK